MYSDDIAMLNGMSTNRDEQLLTAIKDLFFRGFHGFLGFYWGIEINLEFVLAQGDGMCVAFAGDNDYISR